jgi:hypothetical protein
MRVPSVYAAFFLFLEEEADFVSGPQMSLGNPVREHTIRYPSPNLLPEGEGFTG